MTNNLSGRTEKMPPGTNPNSLKNLRPWKPGESGNPTGLPNGKKISTWMFELGQHDVSEWDTIVKAAGCPGNAMIALARLKKSLTFDGERSTEIVLERTEGLPRQIVSQQTPEQSVENAKLLMGELSKLTQPIDIPNGNGSR